MLINVSQSLTILITILIISAERRVLVHLSLYTNQLHNDLVTGDPSVSFQPKGTGCGDSANRLFPPPNCSSNKPIDVDLH